MRSREAAECRCQRPRLAIPPFREAAWIQDDRSRSQRLGQCLECPLCDRTELPDGLREVRTTEAWDGETVPPALQRSHRIAAGTWGLLRVERGRLGFHADTSPPLHVVIETGDARAIPPEVGHHVEVLGEVRFTITFLRP